MEAKILEARKYRKAQDDAFMRKLLLAYEVKLISNFLFGEK